MVTGLWRSYRMTEPAQSCMTVHFLKIKNRLYFKWNKFLRVALNCNQSIKPGNRLG